MTVQGVTKEALKAVRDRLVAIGFRKRTGDIYTRPIEGDALGWIGLQRATQPDGAVAVIPTVGVHHPVVERLVHEFDEVGKPGVTATLARPLGYVFPEPGWLEWEFRPAESFDPVCDNMIEAIARFVFRTWSPTSSLTRLRKR